MGKKAFSMLWEPQLRNKMGKYADEISLVWFWTRIYKRTPSLAYPEGGFLTFANHLVGKIKEANGEVLFNTETVAIHDDKKTTITVLKNGKKTTLPFDKVIVTLPSFLFLKLTPQLPDSYRSKLQRHRGLGATNKVIRLKKPLMQDGTYWLSICEKNSPVMVVVEHTNLISTTHYDNEHLVYVGNYPEADSEEFSASKEELLKRYDPILKKINPGYKKDIIDYEVFRAPFAQPIVPVNYSTFIPAMTTPLPHVFLANIEQVYPWDRGTNYAVELGQKVANLIKNHQ
jgi:protoporphyrinogen oxidase